MEKITASWFLNLRNQICAEFEKIEHEYCAKKNLIKPAKFKRKRWKRNDPLEADAGGGEMSLLTGRIFEKVGVNISTVHGHFSEEFRTQIPGTENSAEFFATGISLVAHPASPLVPAVHMNTRFIKTEKFWFGGGADLNPAIVNNEDTKQFHQALKKACNKHDKSYYPKFKKYCDEYFFIKHRGFARGVGGVFFDYLNNDNFAGDFKFVQEVGTTFLEVYAKLVRANMFKKFTEKQREQQLIKRGYYAEFNLLYDRGTKFGLMTGGNTEAILMSLPPIAKWK